MGSIFSFSEGEASKWLTLTNLTGLRALKVRFRLPLIITPPSSWWELDCTSAWKGCPCKYDQLPPLLFLRGLCPFSTLWTRNLIAGTRFTPVQRPHDLRNVWFKSQLSSKIHWHANKWTLNDDVANATAITNAPKDSYALGKNEWMVTGDDGCILHRGEPYSIFLKLTGCLEGEFTCDDGACVSMEQRCDQLPGEENLISWIKHIVWKKVVLSTIIRLSGRIGRE